METNNTDSCPHCGAEPAEQKWNWKCGSYNFPDSLPFRQSTLCLEREKSNKLTEELNRLTLDYQETLALLERRNEELGTVKRQNKEDLSKLTEAVELGSKQAEVFDELYTKVHKIASNAIESLEICHKAKIIPTQYYEKYLSELLELPNP